MRSNVQEAPATRPNLLVRHSSLLGTLLVSVPAQAASLLDCEAKDSLLICQMRSLLTLLHLVAIILAFLLAFAILFAVHAYRSKPRETPPSRENKLDVQ